MQYMECVPGTERMQYMDVFKDEVLEECLCLNSKDFSFQTQVI